MAELEGTCRTAGCTEQHRHPITGATPDYHFVVGIHRKPVYTDPSYRQRSKNHLEWWYRAKDVALACDVRPPQVVRWIKAGRLRATRAVNAGSSRWLIRGSDLEEFLRSSGRAYPKQEATG